MTRLEFDHLVEKLEARFKGRQASLTRSAVLWAILGYVVLVLGFLSAAGVMAGCVWMAIAAPSVVTIKLGLVLGLSGGLIALGILKGVWVRMTPPEGELLERHDAPRLFEMIDGVSEKAGGVHFDRVLLTDELNASVVQLPRLGIFGWYRTYLSLGLPLLDALSPEEFQAVLAHEFAHLSKAHGRTGNWLYRIRNSWGSVANALAMQGGLLAKPLSAFVGWFWPRFNARAFVLSRANEYEADAFAAETTSAAVSARALQRIAVESRRVHEDFWEDLGRRSAFEPGPPKAVYHDLSSLLKTRVEPAVCMRWLNHQLAMSTDTSDTHPGLRDRIAALGVTPETRGLEAVVESAADRLLGVEFAAEGREKFSKMWIAMNGEEWARRHESATKDRERLKELEALPPTEDNRWEALHLRCGLEGVPAMRGELERWLATHPDHDLSRFVLGRHLLSNDDPAGIALVERAAEGTPVATYDCLEVLAAYYDRQGNAEAVREIKRRADEHDHHVELATRERNVVAANDRFVPHGLPPEMIRAIQEVLAGQAEVTEAWLAEKQVRVFPRWKHHVLVVHLKFPMLKLTSQSDSTAVLQRIADSVTTDSYLLCIDDSGPNKPAAKAIKGTPGTGIYKRG